MANSEAYRSGCRARARARLIERVTADKGGGRIKAVHRPRHKPKSVKRPQRALDSGFPTPFFSGDLCVFVSKFVFLPRMLLVICLVLGIALASVSGLPHARASDLYYTDITPVTDDTRYTSLNPDVKLQEMDKVKHSKGNVVFSSGKRAPGKQPLEFRRSPDSPLGIYPPQATD